MRQIPIFPLGMPVMPFTAVPLHLFEDRYRVMMDHLMEGDRTLGFVMIERGSEVGGGDTRRDVGTLARIVEADQLDDGRWLIIAAGSERMRVVAWLPDDPYPRGAVETLEHGEVLTADAADLQAAVRRMAALAAELGEPGPPIDLTLADDPVIAAYQALAATPIGPLDMQRALETNDAVERHEMVTRLLADAEELLRLQIGSG